MKLGKIWKRGKRKFRYAYIKEEVKGRARTAKVLMILHAGVWVVANAAIHHYDLGPSKFK